MTRPQRCLSLIAFLAACLQAAPQAERARALPRAAIRVEHHEALKDVILDGDLLFAFCVREPDPAAVSARQQAGRAARGGQQPDDAAGAKQEAGAAGRRGGGAQGPREFPKVFWNEEKFVRAVEALNAVHDSRVRKTMVISSVEDLKANLSRFPKDLAGLAYNTEPGLTPPEELKNIEASVIEFAKVAHAAGLTVGWGPTNAMLMADEARFLGLSKYVDSMGLQHQRILENAGIDAFIAQTKRRSEIIHNLNPKTGVTVQVVVGRGSNQQCIDALRGVLPYVTQISVWTVKDTASEAQILRAVRASKP